jgi:hypothetical protein
MQTKTLLLACPALFVIVTSCGPLVPLSYDKKKLHNELVQTLETKDAVVSISYMHLQNNHYIFDLEIVNLSPEDIQVAPQQISFYASPKILPSIKDSTVDVHALTVSHSVLTMRRQFANSPAQTKRIYDDEAKLKTGAATFFTLLAVGLVVYDAAKDSKDYYKETWTKEDEQKSIGRDLLVSTTIQVANVTASSAYHAKEDNHYIPFELLPECTVKPNDSVRGKIFIPIEYSYRFSRVVVPVAGMDYVFDFKRRSVRKQ